MNIDSKMILGMILAGVSIGSSAGHPMRERTDTVDDKPNILMIVCEDISAYLGCYGD